MGDLKTKTSTTKTSVPGYVDNAQQNLLNTAVGISTPFLQPQQYSVAGQTADQTQAGNLARQSAMGAFNTDWSSRIAGAGGGYTPTTVSGSDIMGQMNPFTDAVIDPTLAGMGRARDAQDAQIGARNASSSSFGGSGAALERAQLNRGYGEQVANTEASLRSAAYDRASQLAGQNADRTNAAGASNANLGLQSALGASGASNSQFNNQQTALQTLLGYGNQQQQYNQSVIDVPKNNLDWLKSFVPSAYPQTSQTKQPPVYNPLSSLLGLLG